MDTKHYTYAQLEDMTEAELEGMIMRKEANTNDVRYTLGRLMIEGASDKVPKNENKGLNWLKDACKQNHTDAMEYKTYWDIRFDRQPKIQKIKETLEKVIEANKSCRACNTLAELNHASAGSDLAKQNPEAAETAAANKINAAKFYQTSAE
jgi:TPR repeat protein